MAMKVIGQQSGDPVSAVASSSAQTAITDVHPSANGRLQNSLCLQTTFLSVDHLFPGQRPVNKLNERENLAESKLRNTILQVPRPDPLYQSS